MFQMDLWVFGVLAATVALSVYLERNYAWARSYSSVLTSITLGLVISNIGLIPTKSPVYSSIFKYLVPIAIFFILLQVTWKEVKKAGPTLLLAFVIGSITTIVGALVSLMFFGSLIGDEAWKAAGMFTATYIGGGINYVAVGNGLNVSPELFSGGAVADNVTTSIWLIVCLVTPRFMGKKVSAPAKVQLYDEPKTQLDLLSLSFLSALGIFIFFVSHFIHQVWPMVPVIIWVTTFAIILAHVPVIQKLQGADILGNYLILLFFVVLGAISDIREMLEVGLYLFFFTMLIVLLHGILLYGVGRLFKVPAPALVVASQACVGGAPTAVAVARTLGLRDYLASGAAIGVLGYGVGNYAGFAMASLFKAFF